MEQTVPLSFVTWLVGFLVALLGGCWAIFKYFENQINISKKDTSEKLERVYERMDQNKAGYYNDFILTKVFQEANSARKEIVDEKFEGLKSLINEKIESLKIEIRNSYSRKNNIP